MTRIAVRLMLGLILSGLLGPALAGPSYAEAGDGTTTTTGTWPVADWLARSDLEGVSAEVLSAAIREQTVNPPGNEARLAGELARLLEQAGLEARVVPTPGLEGGPGRAAVWGRLAGRSDAASKPPGVVLLSHLDTVPARAEDWSVAPFAGQIEGGFVWGRGALDAKGVTVTHLMTLIELARRDAPLDRDLILLATPDEETGGLEGAGWLVRHHPELFAGAGYLLTEGGGIQAKAPGEGPTVWGVTLTEKAPCWLELRARGRAGHSSTPAADAAVPRLVAALDKIRRIETPVQVRPEVAAMFARLAPLASEWERGPFRDLAQALADNAPFRQRFLDVPGQNALVRNTISITVLEGASKTNIAPALARAQLDARLLPGERCEDFAAFIAERIDDPSIEIETILSFPAAASSADTPLFRSIAAIASREPGSAVVVPRMIGGFTDAHWFRERGLVAYGFVPRALAREEARGVHGLDERASTKGLVESIRLSIDILRDFDGRETEERAGR